MGIDYKFYCNKCKKTGGGFSSQAWGTGNADIIDSFRFLMKHRYCGGFNVLNSDSCEDIEQDMRDDLLGYYPHSSEWCEEVNEKEYKKYLEYCKNDEGIKE